MADDLLGYYERELSFLRQIGGEFAEKYPKIAARLLLEARGSEDPHVERLIQAFAFLTARVRHKIDDELPEVTDALLGVLYPHYLAPIPSMAVVQFVLDPEQGKLTSGHRIERGATLYSQPVNGESCRFRTCYPVTLWPVEVVAAGLESPSRLASGGSAAAAIRLELRCLADTSLAELALDQLRFFLHGESQLVHALYEILFNTVREVRLRPLRGAGAAEIALPPDSVRPVGFGPDEGILPYPNRSFLGYRLLQEYFAFPQKYLFFDLCNLGRAAQAGFPDRIEVLLLLNRAPRLEQAIGPDTFRLGCTPVVNLFDHTAEPIRLSQTESEYRVIPDVRRQGATEIYSVDAVTSVPPSGEAQEFQPFYSVRHGGPRQPEQAYWYATRRPSQKRLDAGTEVYLSLVDLAFRPTLPAADTLTVRATCTNRDLPGKLPFGGERGDFDLEGAAPITRIRCVTKPTDPFRPPLRRGAHWRLISHLSLNYLSVCGGAEPLQEILKLYDFADTAVVQQQIAGVLDVRSRRVVTRLASMPGNGFCRGLEVTVQFDEDKYVGSGVYLFASVLERFLGLYASLNSFVQFIATSKQREEAIRRWPPRAGEQILL